MVIKIRDGGAWVDVGGGGGLAPDSTISDLINVNGATISADDAGADRIWFWDDSAGKATHLSVGSGLQISGTTLSATSDTGNPAGTVIYSASSTVPAGYIKANGASLNKTTYANLFAAIGYTYGGTGSSFNAPDLRGEFIRGWDDGRGVDSGRGFGSNQSDSTALPNNPFGTSNPGSHTHYYNTNQGTGGGQGGGGADTGSRGDNTGHNGAHTHTINGGDPETRPRNVALLALIKY